MAAHRFDDNTRVGTSQRRRPTSNAAATHVRSGSWRAIAARLLLVVAGLAMGLLIAEVGARTFGLAELPSPRRAVYAGVSHEWCCGPEIVVNGVQRFEPSTSFQHCYSGAKRDWFDANGCVTYRLNSQGYRGHEFQIDKPPATYRIVVIGDSFTFGEGVPESDVFPARLEAALTAQAGARHVEVINLGFPAADTGSEATTYARVASALHADWVILQWNTNDYPTSQVQQDHLRLIGAEYRDVFAPPPAVAWSRVLRYAVLQYRLRQISRDLLATTTADAEQGRAVLGGIGAIAKWARADGSKFTLLIFPELIRFDDYPYATILNIVRDYAREHQIDTVDLLPTLAQHRDRDLWVHVTDHHPNPIAHEIAARALADHAEMRSGLIISEKPRD